jgi:hypothetical protein
MRAPTITAKSRRRRTARHVAVALILGVSALAVCVLAIPVSATASPGSEQSSASASGDSSLSGEPPLVSEPAASTGDGFDWSSAAVGAGAVLALLALGGAVLLTVRGHTAMSPTASARPRRGDCGEAGDGR